MTWTKIDDGYPSHPKVTRCHPLARYLNIVAMTYCNRNGTDGALTSRAVKIVLAEADVPKKYVQQLHDAGLWNRTADGYLINDFLEYNPSREQVAEIRKAAAERQRRRREEQGRNADGTFGHAPRHCVSHGVTDDARHDVRHTAPTRPVEVKTIRGEVADLVRKAQAKAQ